jgi:hypothetical protein
LYVVANFHSENHSSWDQLLYRGINNCMSLNYDWLLSKVLSCFALDFFLEGSGAGNSPFFYSRPKVLKAVLWELKKGLSGMRRAAVWLLVASSTLGATPSWYSVLRHLIPRSSSLLPSSSLLTIFSTRHAQKV